MLGYLCTSSYSFILVLIYFIVRQITSSFLRVAVVCRVTASNYFTVMFAVRHIVMVVVAACFSNSFCVKCEERFVFFSC